MSQRRLTVLVVEADLPLALEYQLDLLRQGHLVNVVDSAEEALRVITPRYDLLITDLWLPAMSGEDLIRSLRARPEFADLPILVLTAARALPEALGGRITLRRKPFDLDDLGSYADEAAGEGRFRN